MNNFGRSPEYERRWTKALRQRTNVPFGNQEIEVLEAIIYCLNYFSPVFEKFSEGYSNPSGDQVKPFIKRVYNESMGLRNHLNKMNLEIRSWEGNHWTKIHKGLFNVQTSVPLRKIISNSSYLLGKKRLSTRDYNYLLDITDRSNPLSNDLKSLSNTFKRYVRNWERGLY